MKNDDMDFFHKATQVICGSLDLQKVLDRSFSFFNTFMPIDSISIQIYDQQTNGVVNVVGTGTPGYTLKGLAIQFPQHIKQAMDARMKNDPVEVINNVGNHKIGKYFLEHLGPKEMSVITMLLTVDGELLGIITFAAGGHNRFSGEHGRRIRLLQGPFAIALSNTLKHKEVTRLKELLEDDNKYLNRQLHHISGDEIIGGEFGLKDVMESVRQIALQKSLVLLLGETGVGKEVIANAIHYSSPRSKGPFIKVNCGAIPDNLIDSELFGHEKGAFTGALSLKRGLFERADNGTIFLDEIGELPLNAQIRLLRVLQNKEIERVGGTTPILVDIRIIAATHRNLQEMVTNGLFREDLWYRLNVFPITIPPLRQRKSDIPALTRYFMERKAREMNLCEQPFFAAGSLETLQFYDWPGNVRELENMVERTIIRSLTGTTQKPLCFEPLVCEQTETPREPVTTEAPAGSLLLEEINREHIIKVLQMTTGKVQGEAGAAALLGVNPSTLRNKMKKLNIPFRRKEKTRETQ